MVGLVTNCKCVLEEIPIYNGMVFHHSCWLHCTTKLYWNVFPADYMPFIRKYKLNISIKYPGICSMSLRAKIHSEVELTLAVAFQPIFEKKLSTLQNLENKKQGHYLWEKTWNCLGTDREFVGILTSNSALLSCSDNSYRTGCVYFDEKLHWLLPISPQRSYLLHQISTIITKVCLKIDWGVQHHKYNIHTFSLNFISLSKAKISGNTWHCIAHIIYKIASGSSLKRIK